MNEAFSRFLRGPWVSRRLSALGIDVPQFWLLIDLFAQLSDRRELFSQLGTDGVALKSVAMIYAAMVGIASIVAVSAGAPWQGYLAGFMAATAFVLLSLMIAETSNSLVNPVEGIVLAHQPVNGATYTAAKLSHLLRILLYLVPATNLIPAGAGLALKGTSLGYPLLHLSCAVAVGLTVTLFCCAVFGWLIRLVSPARLKAAGQMAEFTPWLAMIVLQANARGLWRFAEAAWRHIPPSARYAAGAGLILLAAVAVAFGIRSLSIDYLIRVTSIQHGAAAKKRQQKKSWIGDTVARWCGGAGSRAGFEYVLRMMARDLQFRRQLLPLSFSIFMGLAAVVRGIRTNPFSGEFSVLHIAPHILGLITLVLCMLLAFGGDYKASWVFLLAPDEVFRPFSRGVYAALSFVFVMIPHVILLAALIWFWPLLDAFLFIAFSLSVASAYLSIALRLIQAVPFSKQPDPARGAAMLPIMVIFGLVLGVAVALQHFLLFRSRVFVAAAALILAVATYAVTKVSMEALYGSIRYQLGLLSAEIGEMYREVDV